VMFAFRLLEGYLDPNEGQTFGQIGGVVAGRLEEAIAAARQSGPSRAFVRELGIAAAATVVLGLAVWILSLVRLWLRRRIDAQLTWRLHLGLQERAGIMRTVRALGQIIFGLLVAILIP